MNLGEIEIWDIDFTNDCLCDKRKALVNINNIDSITEMSSNNLNLNEDRFDKIIAGDKIFACQTTCGTKFLIKEKEYNDIKIKAKLVKKDE